MTPTPQPKLTDAELLSNSGPLACAELYLRLEAQRTDGDESVADKLAAARTAVAGIIAEKEAAERERDDRERDIATMTIRFDNRYLELGALLRAAEAARDASQVDAERLNWLNTQAVRVMCAGDLWRKWELYTAWLAGDIRSVIDAARKETGK